MWYKAPNDVMWYGYVIGIIIWWCDLSDRNWLWIDDSDMWMVNAEMWTVVDTDWIVNWYWWYLNSVLPAFKHNKRIIKMA